MTETHEGNARSLESPYTDSGCWNLKHHRSTDYNAGSDYDYSLLYIPIYVLIKLKRDNNIPSWNRHIHHIMYWNEGLSSCNLIRGWTPVLLALFYLTTRLEIRITHNT